MTDKLHATIAENHIVRGSEPPPNRSFFCLLVTVWFQSLLPEPLGENSLFTLHPTAYPLPYGD